MTWDRLLKKKSKQLRVHNIALFPIKIKQDYTASCPSLGSNHMEKPPEKIHT